MWVVRNHRLTLLSDCFRKWYTPDKSPKSYSSKGKYQCIRFHSCFCVNDNLDCKVELTIHSHQRQLPDSISIQSRPYRRKDVPCRLKASGRGYFGAGVTSGAAAAGSAYTELGAARNKSAADIMAVNCVDFIVGRDGSFSWVDKTVLRWYQQLLWNLLCSEKDVCFPLHCQYEWQVGMQKKEIQRSQGGEDIYAALNIGLGFRKEACKHDMNLSLYRALYSFSHIGEYVIKSRYVINTIWKPPKRARGNWICL